MTEKERELRRLQRERYPLAVRLRWLLTAFEKRCLEEINEDIAQVELELSDEQHD